MSQKSSQDAKSIGARFRSARSLVPNLNRKLFCERYGINRYTMQSWENGLHVSKGKNVERFIEALAREGVFCTSEWLTEGLGEPAKPMFPFLQTVDDVKENLLDSKSLAQAETDNIIDRLHAHYKELGNITARFQVLDDAMAPKFLAGDVVLGRLLEKHQERNAHQKFCIVELGPGRHVVRKAIYHKDSYILLALDERVPTFSLKHDSRLYVIAWHFINQ